ncbi:DUF433 domain-containing protein [Subtercola lobariae]|uniref:HTH merR-type domain-containing protein n=1 Tax=Subtercola lobariae TaxID=1588641 RepID=A0A917EY13_9MICO|nr:DUF433 domain-containing protein [Subtercola lobariae]GGF29070.1 hypothetical protein GCM10011399_22720 [Subtercola lobariae]
MSFPTRLTTKMTGTTRAQLAYWRKHAILVPEIESAQRPYLYSFRDIVDLRVFAYLRGTYSLAMIRKMLSTLRELDMVERPGSYELVTMGSSIAVRVQDGTVVDLVKQPGNTTVGTLADVFGEFVTVGGKKIDDLFRPREGVQVDPRRLGGWPTIAGTRIPFDTIADLISDGSIAPDKVGRFYPGVTAKDARDALDYQASIRKAS